VSERRSTGIQVAVALAVRQLQAIREHLTAEEWLEFLRIFTTRVATENAADREVGDE
jgi:hypothetical protein